MIAFSLVRMELISHLFYIYHTNLKQFFQTELKINVKCFCKEVSQHLLVSIGGHIEDFGKIYQKFILMQLGYRLLSKIQSRYLSPGRVYGSRFVI